MNLGCFLVYNLAGGSIIPSAGPLQVESALKCG